ncbi:nitroreductase family protein [Enterovirga rhinocerotis]|uniref:Nitroreductase n=1 Tax=Enterovirga rhinocerotis TaxID=1339210 RepID=A0A4V3DXQ6_9HYPH|nr:nitroreductase family protein [Enterovirga rhinocerotis]TDR89669.1 nitroreductase [Enterovirga rhinocerotis]
MAQPIVNTRKPAHPIEPIFTERWSPRSFTGEEIPAETLLTMLEAGRWSPSSYNSQPWRFVYARRGTAAFDTFLDLLVRGNQAWCKDASALVFIASSKTMSVPGKDEPVPSRTHSFDAGAAWMAVAIQAHAMGWHAHGMIGLDYDKAAETLGIPDGYALDIAFAIGRRDEPGKLPEGFKAREAPNDRKPLAETAFEGRFPG